MVLNYKWCTTWVDVYILKLYRKINVKVVFKIIMITFKLYSISIYMHQIAIACNSVKKGNIFKSPLAKNLSNLQHLTKQHVVLRPFLWLRHYPE